MPLLACILNQGNVVCIVNEETIGACLLLMKEFVIWCLSPTDYF